MILDEMAAVLSAAGVASTTAVGSTGTAWALTKRELQHQPSRMIAVIATGGFPQEPRLEIDRPTFQLLIRGSTGDSSGLEQKVTDAVNALNLTDGTFSNWTYVDIQKRGDVLYLGRDENQRPLYSVNFLALRSRTS